MDSKFLETRFDTARFHFERACAASREHLDFAQSALRAYGDHGPQVSGCVRDHFPDDTKEILRRMAREVTRESNAAHMARPYRVRLATMRKLGQQIATRDGSGFYGPQPIIRNKESNK